MIQAVESKSPPLHLMLGADSYGLWEKKRAEEKRNAISDAKLVLTPISTALKKCKSAAEYSKDF